MAKAKKGRPSIPAAERKRNNITIRVRDSVKAKLVEVAEENQRSLSEEIENRLERSFSDEDIFDRSLGGPELRHTAQNMVAAFATGGARIAAAIGQDKSPAKWLKDPHCYRAATLSAFEALMVAAPNAGWETDQAYLEIEALKARILTWAVNAGRLPAPAVPATTRRPSREKNEDAA